MKNASKLRISRVCATQNADKSNFFVETPFWFIDGVLAENGDTKEHSSEPTFSLYKKEVE